MIGRSYGTHIDIPKIEVLPNSVAGDHEEGVLRMARRDALRGASASRARGRVAVPRQLGR